MKTPSISVVIPVYNNEKHVEETIQSLINQSLSDWQCFIVDDNSEDTSLAIVKQAIITDHRFKLIERSNLSNKKGANVSRNIGLNKVQGDLVMFLDADDYLSDKCLEQRYSFVQNNLHYDMWVFHTDFVDAEGKYKGHFFNPTKIEQDIVYNLIKHKIPWHTMSTIWRINFLKNIGGWNEEYERLQDVELNIRALLNMASICFSRLPSDSYYRHTKMNQEKQNRARMGFTRLIKDYFYKINEHYSHDKNYLIKINEALQQSLGNLLINYVKFAMDKDLEWEKLYLRTLVKLEIDTKEIAYVENIFKKI